MDSFFFYTVNNYFCPEIIWYVFVILISSPIYGPSIAIAQRSKLVGMVGIYGIIIIDLVDISE